MLDLETMDTSPSAVVLSIGAVRFDERACYERIYLVCASPAHIEDQRAHGRTTSQSTMDWWEKQSPEARALFSDEENVSPAEALAQFADFCGPAPRIWGNGATFDNMILRSMYESYKRKTPWHYTADRCFRTLKSLTKVPAPARVGVHHNALDDAIFQAIWAQVILQNLGIEL